MKNKKIVVNADDFGMAYNSNQAILQSFQLGIISSTTIMCNMPGFEEAGSIAHDNNLINSIGVHLNISEGQPLTEKIKKFPKFYNHKGVMYKSFKGHLLNKDEANAVYSELEEQVKKCIKIGIIPTHFDSHHHMHHYWGIGTVVVELAKAYNVPAVRLRFNWGKLSKQRRFYSELYNYKLKIAGLAKAKYFCEIKSVNEKLLSKNVPMEIMVHPWLNSEKKIVNYVNGEKLLNLMDLKFSEKYFINYQSLG